jgi:signal transduction histidine kinase
MASLVHRRRLVTLPSDSPRSADRVEPRTPDVPPGDALHDLVLTLLQPRAADLAERWTAQARAVLLLDRTDGWHSELMVDAEGLVDALIGGSSGGEGIPERAIGQGLRFGSDAFARGVSLHHVMKSLDLLASMTLYVMESALERPDISPASAADGIRLARRLQRRSALLSLAATRGYMQAYADTLRDRFRHLRHDLRNPLGTIKSVLSLMDDDSVPLEARVNPNFRAMATRNAKSLEELIAERLSDAAALLPVVTGHDVSVRAIACAVRRDLRVEAERRGINILVEQGGSHGQLDAAGLELLLRGALQAAVRECGSGERLNVEFEQAPGRASVIVSHEAGHPPIRDADALERLGTLAQQIGASLTAADRVLVSIQFQPGDNALVRASERERSVPREPGGLSDGEARHDVRGAREGHHGQAGAH